MYIYTCGTASTSWVIVHNLNVKEVVVQVYSSSDEQIVPQSIRWDSTTQCTVTLSVAATGKAIIDSGGSGTSGSSGTSATSVTSGSSGSSGVIQIVPANEQTGTSYTMGIGDLGKCILMNNASANTLVVPPNSQENFALDSRVDCIQIGAGQTTVLAGTNVSLYSKNSYLAIDGQYSGITLHKYGTNSWIVVGPLKA